MYVLYIIIKGYVLYISYSIHCTSHYNTLTAITRALRTESTGGLLVLCHLCSVGLQTGCQYGILGLYVLCVEKLSRYRGDRHTAVVVGVVVTVRVKLYIVMVVVIVVVVVVGVVVGGGVVTIRYRSYIHSSSKNNKNTYKYIIQVYTTVHTLY